MPVNSLKCHLINHLDAIIQRHAPAILLLIVVCGRGAAGEGGVAALLCSIDSFGSSSLKRRQECNCNSPLLLPLLLLLPHQHLRCVQSCCTVPPPLSPLIPFPSATLLLYPASLICHSLGLSISSSCPPN